MITDDGSKCHFVPPSRYTAWLPTPGHTPWLCYWPIFFGWDRGYLTRSHGHRSALGSAEYSGRGTRKMAAGKRKPEATQGKPRNDIVRKTQSLLSVYRFCNCKVTSFHHLFRSSGTRKTARTSPNCHRKIITCIRTM